MSAARRPETLSQAKRWDSLASRFRAAGFCPACAAAMAWSRQLRTACDPCPLCADLDTTGAAEGSKVVPLPGRTSDRPSEAGEVAA